VAGPLLSMTPTWSRAGGQGWTTTLHDSYLEQGLEDRARAGPLLSMTPTWRRAEGQGWSTTLHDSYLEQGLEDRTSPLLSISPTWSRGWRTGLAHCSP
jgi:hypothetical protein